MKVLITGAARVGDALWLGIWLSDYVIHGGGDTMVETQAEA